jgi:hypothetical protein
MRGMWMTVLIGGLLAGTEARAGWCCKAKAYAPPAPVCPVPDYGAGALGLEGPSVWPAPEYSWVPEYPWAPELVYRSSFRSPYGSVNHAPTDPGAPVGLPPAPYAANVPTPTQDPVGYLTNPTGDQDKVLKVNALFVFDTDKHHKAAAGFEVTRKTVLETFARYCGNEYQRKYEPTEVKLNRAEKAGPDTVLKAIKEWETSVYDVLFVYLAGYGKADGADPVLFTNADGTGDGVKRSELVAALRAKKFRSVVLITDVCSVVTDDLPGVGAKAPPPGDFPQHLPNLLRNLPPGSFVDVTTAAREPKQFAALTPNAGSVGSIGLATALVHRSTSWTALTEDWVKDTAAVYEGVRNTVNALNPDDKNFKQQQTQTIDVQGKRP